MHIQYPGLPETKGTGVRVHPEWFGTEARQGYQAQAGGACSQSPKRFGR